MGDSYTHWCTENISLSKNGNFYRQLSLMNSATSKIIASLSHYLVVMEQPFKCTILASTILYHQPVRIQSQTFLPIVAHQSFVFVSDDYTVHMS